MRLKIGRAPGEAGALIEGLSCRRAGLGRALMIA
jgi:hypothetical protein